MFYFSYLFYFLILWYFYFFDFLISWLIISYFIEGVKAYDDSISSKMHAAGAYSTVSCLFFVWSAFLIWLQVCQMRGGGKWDQVLINIVWEKRKSWLSRVVDGEQRDEIHEQLGVTALQDLNECPCAGFISSVCCLIIYVELCCWKKANVSENYYRWRCSICL